MGQQWYYQQGDKTRGPVSRDQLRRLYDTGQLADDTPVIRDGMKEWTEIRAIDDPVPIAPPATVGDPARTAAAPPLSTTTSLTHNSSAAGPRANRRPRSSNHLAFYAAGLLVVAVVAAAVGWIANSLSSPAGNQPNTVVVSRDAGATSQPAGKKDQLESTSPSTSNSGQQHRAIRQTPHDSATVEEPVSVPDDGRSDLPSASDGRSASKTESEAAVQAPGSPAGDPLDSAPEPDDVTTPLESPKQAPQPASADSSNVAGPRTSADSATAANRPIVLFQELDIQRRPKFSVLGTVMSQEIHYRILSEMRVGEADERGFRRVSQVVTATQLVKADALSRGLFEESLKRLRGWQFSYTLNSRGEVIEMRGPEDGKRVVAVEPEGGKGVLITSVMDEDGWKELAELSFFQPDPQGRKNQSWSRQMTHNYEPLGSWFGETTFVPRGSQQGVTRFDFSHKLTYKPPAKGAALAAGGIPLTINNADFKAGTAGGVIHFDTERGRVQSAQEQFHVRGKLSTEVLGQAAQVEVEEQQSITLRVVDQNPWN